MGFSVVQMAIQCGGSQRSSDVNVCLPVAMKDVARGLSSDVLRCKSSPLGASTEWSMSVVCHLTTSEHRLRFSQVYQRRLNCHQNGDYCIVSECFEQIAWTACSQWDTRHYFGAHAKHDGSRIQIIPLQYNVSPSISFFCPDKLVSHTSMVSISRFHAHCCCAACKETGWRAARDAPPMSELLPVGMERSLSV